MEIRFAALLDSIRPVDQRLSAAGQAHLDNLTKPRGSLGRLEELALRLYLMADGKTPAAHPARMFTMAGDHGVAAEGVSLFPQEVTRQMVLNFCAGGAGINVLTRQADVQLRVVDVGTAGGPYPDLPGLIQRKVRPGTANMAVEPAMSRQECLAALLLGAELAGQAADDGIRALGTGEMGIANTTPATALFSALLNMDPADVAGPGTGLDSRGVTHKVAVIRRALSLHRQTIEGGNALDILAAVGGLEIAALAGLILGAAARRLPVAVDGFIATAAYVSAWKIHPAVADYAVLCHASAEPGYQAVMQRLGERPLLDLGLRLGEGTGATLGLFLLRCAAAIFNEMATFSSAGVSSE